MDSCFNVTYDAINPINLPSLENKINFYWKHDRYSSKNITKHLLFEDKIEDMRLDLPNL